MPPSTPETTPPIPTPDAPPAVESTPVIVDPGQPIKVSAWFPDFPPTFSYLAPGEALAVHDRFGKPGSKVKALGGDLYRYTIDTRGMAGGEGLWYFQNEAKEAEDVRVKLGRFTVREAPPALLDRAWRPEEPAARYLVGIDALAAPYDALAQVGTGSLKKPLVWVVVGFVAAVVLL